MVIATFKMAATGAAPADDISVLLAAYIKDNWDYTSPPVAEAEVTFQDDFEGIPTNYAVVVVNFAEDIQYGQIGEARQSVKDTKVIYVVAWGQDAKDKADAMSRHVFNIINSDTDGAISVGIEEMQVDQFKDTSRENEEEILKATLKQDPGRIRYARTNLFYDLVL